MDNGALISGFQLGSYEAWFSSEFDIPVYTLERKEPTVDTSEIDHRRISGMTLPVSNEFFSSFFDRLTFSFWNPPVEHDVVLTMWAPTNTLPHRPKQHRIHLMIGIHRGFFAQGHRDEFSDFLPLEVGQKLNRLFFRYQDKQALESVDTLVMESDFVADMANHYYNIDPDVIIPPPIDTSQYYNKRPSKDSFYFYVGRLAEEKGVKNIVRAFNGLSQKLIVAGDGPQMSLLQSIAKDNIDIIGYISDDRKKELYSKCDGFIQNTIGEPFGRTVVEAMAAGAPVIGVNDGNNPYLIKEGITGILFDRVKNASYAKPKSVKPLREAIKQAESENWDNERIAKVAEEYDIKYTRKKWDRVLSQT